MKDIHDEREIVGEQGVCCGNKKRDVCHMYNRTKIQALSNTLKLDLNSLCTLLSVHFLSFSVCVFHFYSFVVGVRLTQSSCIFST